MTKLFHNSRNFICSVTVCLFSLSTLATPATKGLKDPKVSSSSKTTEKNAKKPHPIDRKKIDHLEALKEKAFKDKDDFEVIERDIEKRLKNKELDDFDTSVADELDIIREAEAKQEALRKEEELKSEKLRQERNAALLKAKEQEEAELEESVKKEILENFEGVIDTSEDDWLGLD